MPKWADPFFIFGMGMQVMMVLYLVYIIHKTAKYVKTSRKYAYSMDLKAWTKVVMDPNGPQRPSPELIEEHRRGMLTEEGKKRIVPPWARKVAMVGMAIGIGFLLYNMATFSGIFDEPEIVPTTTIFLPFTILHLTNVSDCPNREVTVLTGQSIEGLRVLANVDSNVNITLAIWWEMTWIPSPDCNDFIKVLSYARVS